MCVPKIPPSQGGIPFAFSVPFRRFSVREKHVFFDHQPGSMSKMGIFRQLYARMKTACSFGCRLLCDAGCDKPEANKLSCSADYCFFKVSTNDQPQSITMWWTSWFIPVPVITPASCNGGIPSWSGMISAVTEQF